MEELNIVLSAYFYSHEINSKTGLVPYLYEQLDHDDMLQVAFASIHTKIVTIETVRGNKIVIYGSANLRSSRNIEQVSVEQDSALYDFCEEFVGRIIDAYKTIDKSKPIRGNELWEVV
jgi:hypothetical protein